MERFYDLRTRLTPDPGLPGLLRRWGWDGAGVPADSKPLPPGLFPVSVVRFRPEGRGAAVVFAAPQSREEVRKASRQPGVDVLSPPGLLDPVSARFAAESGVAVELCVGELVRLRGGSRVRALQRLRHNARYARRAGAACLLTSGAEGPGEVRSPGDLAALGVVAGLSREEALTGVGRVARGILERRSLLGR